MQSVPRGYGANDKPKEQAVVEILSAFVPAQFKDLHDPQTAIPHPAAYPADLAERLVPMFSFVGDTVLDPFLGTGTTTVAAAKCGRNSIGFEVDSHYLKLAQKRIAQETSSLFSTADVSTDIVE